MIVQDESLDVGNAIVDKIISKIILFYILQVEDSLELYKSKYDIVIVQDESLDVANAIVDKIIGVAG